MKKQTTTKGRPRLNPLNRRIMRGISIDPQLLALAQETGISISAAACDGIRRACERALKNRAE